MQELKDAAAHWYMVGIFLKIAHFQLEAIQNDTGGRTNQSMECLIVMLAAWLRGGDASPAALVQALKSAGMIGLARKMAVKYGENVYYMDFCYDYKKCTTLNSPMEITQNVLSLLRTLNKLPYH